MRVTIAGAGKVGRSIARELVGNGHDVLLIDKDPDLPRLIGVEGAEILMADACEISTLDEARLSDSQVVVAATGDDKTNLVVSLLSKTEYGVPRVVARVNHPKNEWMFDDSWGVDVAVSTPRMLSALVEEAVTVGDLVRLFSFRQGEANLVELTLPADAEVAGRRVGDVVWPTDVALVAIVRGTHVLTPDPDGPLESGDELLFVCSPDEEEALQELLTPGHLPRPKDYA
jgi:trk system potassium uptake protein TrkA